MKFFKGLPPNIETLRTFLAPEPQMFFTYGDTIYGPHDPPPDVVIHEEVHRAQQARLGTEGPTIDLVRGAEAWWEKYRNPDFRLQQEVEAYRAQVRWLRARVTSESRRGVVIALAEALRNPSYGLKITEATALRLLA